MADCPRCHAPLKPDALVSSVCGPTVGSLPPVAGRAGRAGLSKRIRWIIGGGLVAFAAALEKVAPSPGSPP
jgi:hypothetical protein